MPKIPSNKETPNSTWPLDRLADYARGGFDEIQRAGRYTAAQTYRIGRALHFAHLKLLVEGKWIEWLDSVGIPRQTAWEAIKLYEAVKNESDLEGLTSTEAKIKYNVYPETKGQGSGPRAGSSGGGSSSSDESQPTSPMEQVTLLYRRLSTAYQLLQEMTWTADILYLDEVDEVSRYCEEIRENILKARKRIKPIRKVSHKNLIASLEKM